MSHSVRMTDGGVGPPIPSVTDYGWGVSQDPSVSVIRPRIGAALSVFGVTERPVRSRIPRPFTYTMRYGWRMGGLDHPYQSERMTDGGFCPDRNRPWKGKKLIFGRQWRGEEGESGRTFPPQRPRNSTWTRGDTQGSTWISKDTWWTYIHTYIHTCIHT